MRELHTSPDTKPGVPDIPIRVSQFPFSCGASEDICGGTAPVHLVPEPVVLCKGILPSVHCRYGVCTTYTCVHWTYSVVPRHIIRVSVHRRGICCSKCLHAVHALKRESTYVQRDDRFGYHQGTQTARNVYEHCRSLVSYETQRMCMLTSRCGHICAFCSCIHH